MTDEAHAASSPAAEASPPGERDYDAIHAVFMETARGRWFLAEFARRNRNADTSMVLDAVARIERSLTPSKDHPADQTELLAAVGEFVAQARQQAETALQGQPTAEKLTAAYRSSRAIREIAWTLREYGSEADICDRLDAHANAIDRSLDQLATATPDEAVVAIFDDLIQRVEAIGGGAVAATEQAAPDGLPDTAPDQPPADEPVAAAPAVPAPVTATIEAPVDETRPVEAEAAVTPPPARDEAAVAAAEEAHDLAVLDMIAMEMAAPATDDDNVEETTTKAPSAIDADIAGDDIAATPETPGEAFDLCKESPASLGAALIASGAIRPRSLSRAGRFAAIQRLTQAEKVALFS